MNCINEIFQIVYLISVIINNDYSYSPGVIPLQAEINLMIFNEVQFLLVIISLLLGIVLFTFLYYNFKRNITKLNLIVKKRADRNIEPKTDSYIDIHPTPTCICNISGIIRYSNNSFNNVFGKQKNGTNGLTIFNILPSYISETLSIEFDHIQKGNTYGFLSHKFLNPLTNEKYQIKWQLITNDIEGANKELMITFEKEIGWGYIDNKSGESLKLIRQILDNTPIALFIEDYDGIILEVNKTGCNLQQIEREELIGKSVVELHPISSHNEIIERQKNMSHYETFSFKSVSYNKAGKPIPVEIMVTKIMYFGTPALLFLVQDLTDFIENKKEVEEYKIKAEESDRLKSSFLANLSHEVRTPMNSILGFAELLAEPSIESEERIEFIKLIRQSSKDLLTQINNMIDFSKIEAGLISLKVEICQFKRLFANLKDFSNTIPEANSGVQIFYDLPKELLTNSIATDFSRLQQILEIFLHNSIKYTKKGIIEVGVRTKAPQLYEFYVRDTGIGIPEEKHKQIFEKFRQVNDSNNREFSGMGLGLSIASRLIQFLGGHQWVTSEPGKGSEFRCVLPDLLQPQNSTLLQISCGPSTVVNKIMIISPIEDTYNDLAQNSKPINYQIFWAQNAQDMKSMLLSNKFIYILITVDLLPFWTELISKIKNYQPTAQIIGISKNMNITKKEKLISKGLNNAINNPINVSTLVNLIEEYEISPIIALTSGISQN